MLQLLKWGGVSVIFSERVHQRIQAAKTLNLETGCHEIIGYRPDVKGHIRIIVGDGVKEYVHRIVVMEELGRKLEIGEIVRHICNNPRCCNPAHLLIGTIFENNQDRKRSNRYSGNRGKRGPNLTATEVALIKLRLKLGHGTFSLAAAFNRHPEAIRRIKTGESYANVHPADYNELSGFTLEGGVFVR